jgi:hypothetical protein
MPGGTAKAARALYLLRCQIVGLTGFEPATNGVPKRGTSYQFLGGKSGLRIRKFE